MADKFAHFAIGELVQYVQGRCRSRMLIFARNIVGHLIGIVRLVEISQLLDILRKLR